MPTRSSFLPAQRVRLVEVHAVEFAVEVCGFKDMVAPGKVRHVAVLYAVVDAVAVRIRGPASGSKLVRLTSFSKLLHEEPQIPFIAIVPMVIDIDDVAQRKDWILPPGAPRYDIKSRKKTGG